MSLDLYNKVLERFASMEARPEMWAGTREAFGLQLVAFAEMLLDEAPLDDGSPKLKLMPQLMHRVFAGPVISLEPINTEWARHAVAATRAFVEEHRAIQDPLTATSVLDEAHDFQRFEHVTLNRTGNRQTRHLRVVCRCGWGEITHNEEVDEVLASQQGHRLLRAHVDGRRRS